MTDTTQAEALDKLDYAFAAVEEYGNQEALDELKDAIDDVRALFASPPVSNGSSPDRGTADAAAETPPPTEPVAWRFKSKENDGSVWGYQSTPIPPAYNEFYTIEQLYAAPPVEPLSETASTERDKSGDEQQNLSPAPDTVTVGRDAIADSYWTAIKSDEFAEIRRKLSVHELRMLFNAALNGGEHG